MGWGKKIAIGLGAGVGLVAALAIGILAWAALTAENMLQFPDWPSPDLVASSDPEVIARGKYVAHGPGHCATCHSTDDREGFAKILTEPLHGGLEFAMGPMGTRYARNLTPDTETGIGRLTDAQLARAIRSGVMPEGDVSMFMAYSVGELSDEDLVAVMSYLRSLPPIRRDVPKGYYGLLAKVFLRLGFFQLHPRPVEGPAHAPPSDTPSLERGRYLAEHAAYCKACHTSYDPATFTPNGPPFGGGLAEASHGADHDMEYAPPNLTSSRFGYVGRVAEDAFLARFRAGRAHASSVMPWESFSTMTDSDIRSIYRYLKTVPPVEVDTGPGYRKAGSWPEDG